MAENCRELKRELYAMFTLASENAFYTPHLKEKADCIQSAAQTAQAIVELERFIQASLEIGDTMDDGTIYAGNSPDTNLPMYVAPLEAPTSMNFNEASKYANDLVVGNKQDFRIPSFHELEQVYKNVRKGALRSAFKSVANDNEGRFYWSSTYDENRKTVLCAIRVPSGLLSVRDDDKQARLLCIR